MNQNYKAHIELINRQIKELVGLYRDAVKELNVAESEFWIWYTLVAIDGEHTQQDICSLWSLPKQTVNTIIARLRLKRYATLEAIPGTRNHKYIRLTEDGLAYGENLIGPRRSRVSRAPLAITLISSAPSLVALNGRRHRGPV